MFIQLKAAQDTGLFSTQLYFNLYINKLRVWLKGLTTRQLSLGNQRKS